MWDILWWFLLILYVPACIGLIIIVLLQKGKGAGFAGAFGIGAGSETVFGPQTAQGMPVKITYAMAAAFLSIALLMSLISGRVGAGVAPDLVDETAISTVDNAATGLEEFGLGTGVTGKVDTSAISVDAPATESAPIAVETAPADTAEDAAATTNETPAADTADTAVEAPAEDAGVAEPAPVVDGAAADETSEPAPAEPAADAPEASVTEAAPAPEAQ